MGIRCHARAGLLTLTVDTIGLQPHSTEDFSSPTARFYLGLALFCVEPRTDGRVRWDGRGLKFTGSQLWKMDEHGVYTNS